MTFSLNDIEAAFIAAMRAAGIEPEFKKGIEFGNTKSGNPQRFHIAGHKKGTLNGWYVLHADGIPAGVFGDFKAGVTHTWCMKDAREMTAQENAEIQRRIAEGKAARERARKQVQGEAARLANEIYAASEPVFGDDHPYLRRKGVVSHGLRRCDWPVRNADGEIVRTIKDCLIVPLMTKTGKIVSLQAIFPRVDSFFERDKTFIAGGRKQGCFYLVGSPRDDMPVVICEGYATAASIHAATGYCVAIAWDAGNLPSVAEALRELLPHARFIIAADNDRWTTQPIENPGAHYAKVAAAGAGARVVIPEFKSLDGEPTDFNDLHAREGIEAVQDQIIERASVPASSAPSVRASSGFIEPIARDSVDVATPFPDVDGKGKPISTTANLAELLRRMAATVRYNVITKEIEVLIPGHASTMDNRAGSALGHLLDWHKRARIPVGDIDTNLVTYADGNLYNPVATWIESRPWDGRTRLPDLYATVTEAEPVQLPSGGTLKEALMRRWLLSAVAAAFSPDGVVARGVLTIQGEQNLGKTKWFKSLVPRELDVIADGLILDPADKDSVKQCVSKWLVELGEVDATFRKADMARLKAFISRDRDELRRPFARTESRYARRTVFFASVNPERFLSDSTGNTRWWTINAVALNSTHGIDVQQVFAEVLALYRAGESWHLNAEELAALNTQNRDSEEISPIREQIDRDFQWSVPREKWANAMRASDIVRTPSNDRPNKKEVNEAASYVVQRYGVERRKVGKDRQTVWIMPPRFSTESPL